MSVQSLFKEDLSLSETIIFVTYNIDMFNYGILIVINLSGIRKNYFKPNCKLSY